MTPLVWNRLRAGMCVMKKAGRDHPGVVYEIIYVDGPNLTSAFDSQSHRLSGKVIGYTNLTPQETREARPLGYMAKLIAPDHYESLREEYRKQMTNEFRNEVVKNPNHDKQQEKPLMDAITVHFAIGSHRTKNGHVGTVELTYEFGESKIIYEAPAVAEPRTVGGQTLTLDQTARLSAQEKLASVLESLFS